MVASPSKKLLSQPNSQTAGIGDPVIEFPEALCLSGQINKTLRGKRIASVTAGHTPHRLAWYYGHRETYAAVLTGKSIRNAVPRGSMVEIRADGANILFGEGVGVRFHDADSPRPVKHQLLVEFADGSALSGYVQMYGGVGCFPEGGLDNPYYKGAREKPAPNTAKFNKTYFDRIVGDDTVQNISLKALLATAQRIPGLGNGILQDILFNAGQHPKRKVQSLSSKERDALFHAVRSTIDAMVAQGGRNTELDLFGSPGGYETILCRKTLNKPCPQCGTAIKKEAYMGGAIYFCEKCQKI
jgi:formamidopyrimidine-DNA glycosylase